jgi:hypothetical protein
LGPGLSQQRPRVELKRGPSLLRATLSGATVLAIAACTRASHTDAARQTQAVLRSQTAQTTAAVSTSPSSLAPLTPIGVSGGLQPNGPVILQRSGATLGSASLLAFAPKGNVIFVTFSCLGPGKFDFAGLFVSSPCDGTSSTVTLRGQTGKTLALRVVVDASTRWRLMVQDGNEPNASAPPTPGSASTKN